MHVSVIGAGYVGLVTAACLADVGNVVLCIDIDAAKVERLNRSEIPIHEPGLHQLVERNAAVGRLRFATDYDDAVLHATLIFIAVGTPSGEDGSANLTHVIACARQLGKRIQQTRSSLSNQPCRLVPMTRCAGLYSRNSDGSRGRQMVTTASNPEFSERGIRG